MAKTKYVVKRPPSMLASQVGSGLCPGLFHFQSNSLLMFLSKIVEGCIHIWDTEVPVSWFGPGSELTLVAIWEVSHCMKDLLISPPLSVTQYLIIEINFKTFLKATRILLRYLCIIFSHLSFGATHNQNNKSKNQKTS